MKQMMAVVALLASVLCAPSLAAPKPQKPSRIIPTPTITNLKTGDTVHGTFVLDIAIPDGSVCTSTILMVDGVFQGGDNFTPFAIAYRSATNLVVGPHTLVVQGHDTKGVWHSSAPVTVNVIPPWPGDDIAGPNYVAFESPEDWDVVSGIVPIVMEARDDVGVDRIELSVEGNPPIVFSGGSAVYLFDTATYPPGTYVTFTAVAFDAAGNSRSLPLITVHVAP